MIFILFLMLESVSCLDGPPNNISLINCTTFGETILEAGEYVKFETRDYPFLQTDEYFGLSCYHKFKRGDENLNMWFVFLNGEIFSFDITGFSSNTFDYERKTIIWDKQPLWFSSLMEWPEMEFHVNNYITGTEWEGFQALVYAPVSINNIHGNSDCPLNGIDFKFSNTLDIIPIASSYYFSNNVETHQLNSILSCIWNLKTAHDFMFKVHIKQLTKNNESMSLRINLDGLEDLEIIEAGVYYFNNANISIKYEVRSNYSSDIGFGGIVTSVELNPTIINNCSITWYGERLGFENYNDDEGYSNNQLCEYKFNIKKTETYRLFYFYGFLEDGVDQLLAIDIFNNSYDITQSEYWIIDEKAANVTLKFISDGSLNKPGFIADESMISCDCSATNQTISTTYSKISYFSVLSERDGYCSKMKCSFNLLVDGPFYTSIMLVPNLNLRPNSNDIIKIYKNHTMYANITADTKVVNHYIFNDFKNDIIITFESDDKLFGIYPAPAATFGTILADSIRWPLIVDLTSFDYMFTLDLTLNKGTYLFIVNAPQEYTLDFFVVGSDLSNQDLLQTILLYDSNATENFINTLDNLSRHKVYNDMRYYTSTSNSLTLFRSSTDSPPLTFFFRLREIHAANCDSSDNVVTTVYNSTVKAKSSNDGSCYLTILNYNMNTSSWCQSHYFDLTTDSENYVKFIPNNEKFQYITLTTGSPNDIPDIKINDTFFEFNKESVSSWTRLFFYGLSNTFIIPPNTAISFKSTRYTGGEGYDDYNVTKGILTSQSFVDPAFRIFDRNTIKIFAGVTCRFKVKLFDLTPNATLYLYMGPHVALQKVTKVNQIIEFVATTYNEIVYIELNDTHNSYGEYHRGYVIEFEMIKYDSTTFSPPSITPNDSAISSTTSSNQGGGDSAKWWIIGAVLVVILSFATIIILYFLRKKYQERMFEKLQETIKIKMEMSPLEVQLSHEERLTKQLDPKILIIDFDTILGKGANATVYKVFLKGTIKSNLSENKKLNFATQIDENCHAALKLPTSFDQDEVEQFVRELDALIKLGSHSHIITFIGWTLYHDVPALVTELADKNLLQYVKSFRDEMLPIKTIISMLWQISQALEHVASLMMVHRDVACRNILLTENNVAKLADFGLCCHCDESFTYQATIHKRMPLKWLSIEALTERIFSEKSDVWSFGILCFEIFSFGKVPYLALSNEEMVEFLQNGNRLEKPNDTPDSIYSLMLDCWKMDPADRPKFEEIGNSLRSILENETASYGYLTLGSEE